MTRIGGWTVWAKSGGRLRQFTVANRPKTERSQPLNRHTGPGSGFSPCYELGIDALVRGESGQRHRMDAH
jgi:hypothetical protein